MSLHEFLDPFIWLLTQLLHLVTGDYLPASCRWCQPAYWMVEAGLVVLLFISRTFHGPRPG